MNDLDDEYIKKRLIFLLGKVELDSQEIQWFLDYLETKTDGLELREILYEDFLQSLTSPGIVSVPEQKHILDNIREKLYKQLFD